MARPSRIKGPKETLVTDQPGRKIFFTGVLIALILGFFLRGLINPQFVQLELKNAVSKIHPSTQIGWSQAYISLQDGLIPRFSVMLNDVKILSTENCWGQPLLYAREIELPFSFVGFFEKGEPLRSIIVRDSFLEFKSSFLCEKQKKKSDTKVAASATSGAEADSVVESAISGSSAGPIRLKSSAETSSRPPVVLRNFIFENLKLRQPAWVFPDWQLQRLRLRIYENSPWYADLESEFNIPDTEGVDARAQLEVVYKEFPSQILDADIRGHWREGAFRIKGQWTGPQEGWSFTSKFDHFPFQFLKTVAVKTGTPWNWPDKPMWFSFSSQTPQAFKEWKDSQHRVSNLKVEGDLGDLGIPDLQIISWQPFKVEPFAFAIQNADLSAGFSSAWVAPTWVGRWGLLSGQGQWVRENEFHFQGLLQNTEFILNHKDRRWAQPIRKTEVQADLLKGQWKILLDDFDIPDAKGQASLRVEGPQSLKSGRLNFSADDLILPPNLLSFFEVLSVDSKWDWKAQYSWRDGKPVDLTSTLAVAVFESRDLLLEKPILNVRMKNEAAVDFQLVSQNASIREPFPFFSDELRSLEYPMKLGRTQFAWSEGNPGKWQLLSAKAYSKGEIDSQTNLRGSFSLGGQSYSVEGTKTSPLLRLNR